MWLKFFGGGVSSFFLGHFYGVLNVGLCKPVMGA